MIDKALTTIVSKLKSKMGLEGGKLNYLQAEVDQLGKILCSVSDILLEATPDLTSKNQAPITNLLRFRLNFRANFEASSYPEGLRHLSTILHFLYENPLITADNTPNLPSEIEKISLSQVDSTMTEETLPMIIFDVRVMLSVASNTDEVASIA